MEWLTLIAAAVNATIMNWAQLLLENLAKAIIEYRRKISSYLTIFPPLFMSASVMDAIYFFSQFPNMGWKWTLQNPLPIHIYHNILWESQFHPHFYKRCQGIILPIHRVVFDNIVPRFSKEAKVDIFPEARSFGEVTFTYIRVFGSIASLHVLLYYVPNKLLAREIAYQITETRM